MSHDAIRTTLFWNRSSSLNITVDPSGTSWYAAIIDDSADQCPITVGSGDNPYELEAASMVSLDDALAKLDKVCARQFTGPMDID